jgi:hypothetical protein
MAKNGHVCGVACSGGCRLEADGQGANPNDGTAIAAGSASGKR